MEVQHNLQIQIEKPRLAYPISLVIDDGVPCINPLYYYGKQVRPEPFEKHEAAIPLDQMEQFARIIQRYGIRGKFTVIPYPAGLGTILEGWDGCEREEMRRWLEIARTDVAAQFDITPEILTHTLALDLRTRQLLPQSEQTWMDERNEAELEEYMRAAVELLRQAGFAPAGITQPVTFKGDRAAYAKATLEALRPGGQNPDGSSDTGSCGTVCFFFIDFEDGPAPVPVHPLVLLDREKGDAVLSILCYSDDYFWDTQYPTGVPLGQRVDKLISADGQSGRMVELIRGGAWATFVTHWQSLYSNGSREGMAGLEEMAIRLARTFGPRLLWVKNSEIARYRAAEEACRISAISADAIQLDSGFDCPDFTLTWTLAESAAIERVCLMREGQAAGPLRLACEADGLLDSNSWRQVRDGEKVCLQVCLDLRRGLQEITLERGKI